jgi:hypothetical protein
MTLRRGKLGEIRKGLKDRLSTIDALHGHVYATMPSNPQSPAAAVIPRSRALATMDGGATYTFAVWVYVNPSDMVRAQAQLDEYLTDDGPNSIAAAIESDATLGGSAESVSVTGWNEYASLVDSAGGQLLAMRVDVEVFA